MGVSLEGNKYRVRVTVKGKRKTLGYYKTLYEADARLAEHYKELEEQEQFHAAFQDVEMSPLYATYPQLDIEKPSLWDRMKSVWQSIRQRN
jgi:hypothetical protein